MRSLSWQEFEQAVDTMAARYGDRSHTGVYGIPRGALVLAVAMLGYIFREIRINI